MGLISPIVRALREVEARRQLDATATTARLRALEASNDNLCLQLKAANDKYIELRQEIEGMKKMRR